MDAASSSIDNCNGRPQSLLCENADLRWSVASLEHDTRKHYAVNWIKLLLRHAWLKQEWNTNKANMRLYMVSVKVRLKFNSNVSGISSDIWCQGIDEWQTMMLWLIVVTYKITFRYRRLYNACLFVGTCQILPWFVCCYIRKKSLGETRRIEINGEYIK